MNRRDFLRSLAGLPLLGFLKPEGIRMGINAPSYDEPLMTAPAPTITQQLVRWDAVGNHWKSTDGGQAWIQTAKAPSVYVASVYANTNGDNWIQVEEDYPKTSYFRSPAFEDDSLK